MSDTMETLRELWELPPRERRAVLVAGWKSIPREERERLIEACWLLPTALWTRRWWRKRGATRFQSIFAASLGYNFVLVHSELRRATRLLREMRDDQRADRRIV